MSTYWTISNGLRGCYMPDNVYVVRCETRRQLKDHLVNNDLSDDVPGERAIASLAAAAWRHRKDHTFNLPMCASYPDNEGYGLFVSPATREEWLEQEKDNDNY